MGRERSHEPVPPFDGIKFRLQSDIQTWATGSTDAFASDQCHPSPSFHLTSESPPESQKACHPGAVPEDTSSVLLINITGTPVQIPLKREWTMDSIGKRCFVGRLCLYRRSKIARTGTANSQQSSRGPFTADPLCKPPYHLCDLFHSRIAPC